MKYSDPDEIFRLNVRVHGLVQGVGFRFFTQNLARKLGISGFVRNTKSGKVDVEAFGSMTLLEEFLRMLKQGPRSAHVTEMNFEYSPLSQDSSKNQKKEFYIQS